MLSCILFETVIIHFHIHLPLALALAFSLKYFTLYNRHILHDTLHGTALQVFNWLPLAAVIQDAVFVVHGGLTTERGGAIKLEEVEALLAEGKSSDEDEDVDVVDEFPPRFVRFRDGGWWNSAFGRCDVGVSCCACGGCPRNSTLLHSCSMPITCASQFPG